MKYKYYLILFLLSFSFSCKHDMKVEKVKLEVVVEESLPEPPPPPPPQSVQDTAVSVKAHLVYKDGSMSSFDVLNDKSIALWNTIIGGGDAEKPSEKLAVILTGNLKNLHINITKRDKRVLNKDINIATRSQKFIINDTGCDIVKVEVSKDKKIIFKDEVPFRCGE
jgi:hypothetical protein